MPRIINAQADGNTSIADRLRSLGDSMFDNQAQLLLISQNALAKQRENTNRPLAASDVGRGNYAAAVQHGILAGLPISENLSL